MKLSFTTLGCPEWSFAEILEKIPPMGFAGIEIRGLDGEMRAENMAAFKPGVQQDTLRRLKDAGLTLVGFGTSVNFHDAAKHDDMLAEGRAAIDVCARMGIPYIRVFGDAIPDADKEVQTIAQVAAGIAELCDYAKGTSVGVLMEIHGQFNTLERVQSVISQVQRENFGILWDIEHSDKTYGDDFMKFYAPIKPYIRHIHVKDHMRDEKYTLTRIGEGQIPITKIVKQLIKDGYDGWFSLEWEKKWHPELPSADTAYPDYIKLMEGIK